MRPALRPFLLHPDLSPSLPASFSSLYPTFFFDFLVSPPDPSLLFLSLGRVCESLPVGTCASETLALISETGFVSAHLCLSRPSSLPHTPATDQKKHLHASPGVISLGCCLEQSWALQATPRPFYPQSCHVHTCSTNAHGFWHSLLGSVCTIISPSPQISLLHEAFNLGSFFSCNIPDSLVKCRLISV